MTAPGWQWAEWDAPPNVRAGASDRHGGTSTGPFHSLNLGTHVGDEPGAVAENRARLRRSLALPAEPLWLDQVHGTAVAVHDGRAGLPRADAAVAFEAGRVLAVLTADCLPVVLAATDGSRIGIAHAGWRGLAAGVIEATVAALGSDGPGLIAWLGPSIAPQDFEVGEEVRAAFTDSDPGAAGAFVPNPAGRWQADLTALARRRLAALGVGSVGAASGSTRAADERFFSYRREARTGRMATLAWLAAPG